MPSGQASSDPRAAAHSSAPLLALFVGLSGGYEGWGRASVSQAATLRAIKVPWWGAACLDEADWARHGPVPDAMIAALNLKEIWYLNAAVSWGAGDRMAHTAFCNQSDGAQHRSNHLLRITSSCALRRLTVCRGNVLSACGRISCGAALVLRPSLAFVDPTATAARLAPLILDAPVLQSSLSLPIYARFRCVGGVPGSVSSRAHSIVFSEVCNKNLFTHEEQACPVGRRTLDDQLALMPAASLHSYFRSSFLRSNSLPDGRYACPATVRWPEGRLTEALLSNGVEVRELQGVATCLAGAPTNGFFKCTSGEVDFGDPLPPKEEDNFLISSSPSQHVRPAGVVARGRSL